jgi:hypothetical protein
MSMLSSALGSLGSPTTKSLEPAWQEEQRKKTMAAAQPGAMERLGRAGEAYTGDLVAGMSPYEQQGMDQLSAYLNGGSLSSQPLWGQASNELSNTLGGDAYDPVGGTYYQSFRNAVLRELTDAKNRLAANTSASDAFFGGGRIASEGKLEEGAMNTLAQELGRLSENERMNRLNAVTPATQMAQTLAAEPLSKAAAATQLGGLPRTIEQAQYDADYQEWLRQLADLGVPLDLYSSLLTYTPPTAIGPSISQQIAQGVQSAANLISSIKGFGSGSLPSYNTTVSNGSAAG